MPGFSVRKPMTVLVAVILIIVLGVVSFTRMTPDLLPSMDFPYVIVVTSYIGASPEQVESEVTKPIEQSAATLEGIQDISSTSSANYSMVILQFSESSNMDAVTMNLREKLDQISGSWNEKISNPTIMKINPNMLPINVSAVAREGYDTAELSDFVTQTLLPRLEGLEGVASISASGTVFEEVQVVISQEKLDRLNDKIRKAIDRQFTEPEQEISDALEEIRNTLNDLDDGEKALSSGRYQLSQAEKEAYAQFDEAQKQIDDGRAQLEEAYNQAREDLMVMAAYTQAIAAREILKAELDQIPEENPTPEQEQRAQELQAQIADYQNQIDAMSPNLLSPEEMQQAELILLAYNSQKEMLDEAQATLDASKADALKQMQSAKNQLYSGAQQIEDARDQLDNAKDELDKATEEIDKAREDAYDAADAKEIITLEMVAQILGAQDFAMPAGYATDKHEEQWLIYVGDSFQQSHELQSLMLFDMGMEGLDPIYLRDVADVLLMNNADDTYGKINGEDGIMLTFNKQSNYATATVSENILREFEELSAEYEGLSFTPLMDQGDYIHLVVNSVLENLLVGAVLAVIILLLFLWDIRPTFIVACSIPISVTFAIVLMYFSGVTLNLISMSGLAVGVGMLVDNSIVVIENIYRLRKEGVSVIRASISGAVQVAGAITASTLTTVCVFVPIVFVEGMTRQLFQDMALTITYSLAASLVVALTLVPAMSSGMLVRMKKEERKTKTPMDRLNEAYGKGLSWVLRHKAPVMILVTVLLVSSVFLALKDGFIFMPSMDSTQITVTITLEEGATLQDSAKMSQEVEKRISGLEDIQTIGVMPAQGMGAMVGMAGADAQNSLSMYVVLYEDKELSSDEIARQIEELCTDLDCDVSASGSGMDMSMLTGSGISVNLFGENPERLQQAAQQVARELEVLEGVESVSDGMEDASREFRIRVDKNKAMKYGLTTAQVYMEVAKALTTTATAANIDETGDDVVVISKPNGATLGSIKLLEIKTQNTMGEEVVVELDEIAEFDDDRWSVQSIQRSNQRRYMTVNAALKDGYNVTLLTEKAQMLLRNLELPEGVRYEFTGENETIMDAMNDLMLMMLLGIIIVYLIMVAQFQSLLSPFIVMFTIPLAFTGGLFALWMCGLEVSIIAVIGFVMLVGVIVNNGIVLIDAIIQLREGGMELHEAVITACKQRLRPVLMTALTTILAMIPMALAVGMGASLIQPVAVVSIGGLVYATFMTLFVVPLIYEAWCKKPPRVVSREDMEILDQ